MSSKDNRQLLIEMVMRQTHYTYEEASDKLSAYNDNYLIVIRDSLGIKKVEEKEITSINQGIYTEIRGLMDIASQKYRREQEREQKKQEIIELLRKKQEEMTKTSTSETIAEDTNETSDSPTVKSDEMKQEN